MIVFKRLIINWNIVINSVAIVLIFVSIFYRFIYLSHIPGINGDEPFGMIKPFLFGTNYQSVWSNATRFYDPLYLLIAFLLHWVIDLPPSFLVLRIPPLFYGVLTIILSFFLFKKIYGKDRALFITLLIAVLPMHIAYSRFSWDPSQTPFIALLCLYFAFSKKWLFLIIAYSFALLVHPTNIFLFPILCLFFVQGSGKYLLAKRKKKVFSIVCYSLLLITIAFVIYRFFDHYNISLNRILSSPRTKARLMDWQSAIQFAKNYSKYFAGVPVYSQLSGSLNGSLLWFHIYPFYALFGFLILSNLFIFRKQKLFTWALIISLFGFYLFGSGAVFKNRYAIWATVPICIWLVNSLFLMSSKKWMNWMVKISLIIMACFFLFSFNHQYFNEIKENNNQRHRTFLTGPNEPKKVAFELIEHYRNPDLKTIVLAEEWWLYWPIKYLSYKSDNYLILETSMPSGRLFPPDRLPDDLNDKYEIFLVLWHHKKLQGVINQKENFLLLREIFGYGDLGILKVFLYKGSDYQQFLDGSWRR